MRACRQALNAFLLRYPLCYGYWKKFADLERRAGHIDKAEEVRTCIDGHFSQIIQKKQEQSLNIKLLGILYFCNFVIFKNDLYIKWQQRCKAVFGSFDRCVNEA